MQTGDIIFIAETGFIPDLIRFFDKGPFDHVCIAISDTDIIEAQYQENVEPKPFPYANEPYAIVSLDLTDEEKAKLPEIVKPFIGEDYNYEEIVSIIIRFLGWEKFDLFDDKDDVICSQLAAYIAQRLGKADKGTELLAPNQLFNYFEKKYSVTWYNK